MPEPTQDRAEGPLRQGPTRVLFLCLGWFFFGLGVIGVVLPVMPTTPFMLLALWAFSSSSRRFHDWLYHHRVFGPPLRRWRRDRVIPAWAKVLSLSSMAASITWVGFFVRPPWYAVAAMAIVLVASATIILRFPSRVPTSAG